MSEETGRRADDVPPRRLSTPTATILWDRQHWLPLERCLSTDEIVLLLTPVVVPPRSQLDTTSDPFEPLGQLLSQRKLAVWHVPYTRNGGITGAHVAFIKRADAVIFIVTGFSMDDKISQPEMANLVAEACEPRPMVVVACCDIDEDDVQQFDFPTMIRASGFSLPDLRAVSSALLDGSNVPIPPPQITAPPADSNALRSWTIQPCNYEQDLPQIYELWLSETTPNFHLGLAAFSSLLRREGYAMHHVVRAPTQEVIGFCATYTTFADSLGEKLIGSIAALIIRQDFRRRRIGKTLYEEALSKLTKIRGVCCIQLGSTFPRLLYGLPKDHADTKWFQRLGWVVDQPAPGKGRIMADWFLRFADGPAINLASAGLHFRPCRIEDVEAVTEMVGRESERKFGFGWFDQYTQAMDSSHIGDVIVGFEGATLAAAAITHTPNGGSQTAADIPWASSIGPDIGGISCICIKGKPMSREVSNVANVADPFAKTMTQNWSIGGTP